MQSQLHKELINNLRWRTCCSNLLPKSLSFHWKWLNKTVFYFPPNWRYHPADSILICLSLMWKYQNIAV